MEENWQRLAPQAPFQYTFLDDNLDRFYNEEVRFGKIIGWGGGLSIFLSCLGLFGLATLAAANRTKEVGIRKVLGASYTQLVGLLSRDFLGLVLIALVVAAPFAWYIMQVWLESFAFRISINWWHIALAGVAALLITFFTVALQSIRAVLSNPVETLRYE
jgi:putative ABC transport system permease protein